MTLNEKLAHFLEVTVTENTKESKHMLDAYQTSLDEQFAAHKEQMIQQAEAEIFTASEAIRRDGNKELAHEHLVLKRTLTQKNNDLTNRLFEELAALLTEYKKTPDYISLLLLQIQNAKNVAGDDVFTIYLDSEDADKLSELEKKSGCVLTVSQYSFGGGTRAVIPSRHILIDNSFDSKIAEQRENFQFNGGITK